MKGGNGCLLQVYTGPPAGESESVHLGASLKFEQPLAWDLLDGPAQAAKGGPRWGRAAGQISALPDHMAASRAAPQALAAGVYPSVVQRSHFN